MVATTVVLYSRLLHDSQHSGLVQAVITQYLAQWPFIKGGIFFLWKTQYLYLLFRSLGYFRQKRMETRYGVL
jgi:hypothetical protein